MLAAPAPLREDCQDERVHEQLFARLLDNRVHLRTARYAAIIGACPSRGARSPRLWDAAFAALGMDAAMLPFDVQAAALPALVEALHADPRFLGGAVAVPHKGRIARLLARIDPVAHAAGAVNALYRTPLGVEGANSDGHAALAALRAEAGDLSGRRVMVLGCGATGRAIAAALAGGGARVALSNRTILAAAQAAASVPGAVVAAWPPTTQALAATDMLVNATSVGHAPDGAAPVPLTALSAAADAQRNRIESEAAIAALPAHAFVFDAVYQPRETLLLALAGLRGLRRANGTEMNRLQAVRAFCLALPSVDAAMVGKAMGRIA